MKTTASDDEDYYDALVNSCDENYSHMLHAVPTMEVECWHNIGQYCVCSSVWEVSGHFMENVQKE